MFTFITLVFSIIIPLALSNLYSSVKDFKSSYIYHILTEYYYFNFYFILFYLIIMPLSLLIILVNHSFAGIILVELSFISIAYTFYLFIVFKFLLNNDKNKEIIKEFLAKNKINKNEYKNFIDSYINLSLINNFIDNDLNDLYFEKFKNEIEPNIIDRSYINEYISFIETSLKNSYNNQGYCKDTMLSILKICVYIKDKDIFIYLIINSIFNFDKNNNTNILIVLIEYIYRYEDSIEHLIPISEEPDFKRYKDIFLRNINSILKININYKSYIQNDLFSNQFIEFDNDKKEFIWKKELE